MKVTLWMATSLNGFIARENNEEDFISKDSWNEWLTWIKSTGCMIWGRKTHEVVKTWEKEYFDDIKGVKAIIVSSNKNYEVSSDFELVSSPQEALAELEKGGFKEAILTGGSGLNSSFAKLGLINEVVLNIEPVVVGKGIPLFSTESFDLNLELIETKKVTDNLIQLRYKVKK